MIVVCIVSYHILSIDIWLCHLYIQVGQKLCDEVFSLGNGLAKVGVTHSVDFPKLGAAAQDEEEAGFCARSMVTHRPLHLQAAHSSPNLAASGSHSLLGGRVCGCPGCPPADPVPPHVRNLGARREVTRLLFPSSSGSAGWRDHHDHRPRPA